jgi:hypothetical protein
VIISHWLKLLPPEIVRGANPVEIIKSRELKSKTLAKRSLKIGLQDLISQIKDFPPELRSTIDMDLTANELPSLNELQGSNARIIARVLRRKQIKTPEEFYVVKEEVIDQSSDLNDTDREVLDKALFEFEFSKNSTHNTNK